MKKVLFILSALALLVSVGYVNGQVGKTFPAMTCENIQDQKVNLPEATKGKYTILGLAYSQKAEENLLTWLQPAFTTFIEKRKQDLFSMNYDVNVYFIAMFTGANQSAYQASVKRTKQNLQDVLRPHVLFYKGDIDTYQKELSMKNKELPYIFVLDDEGNIVHFTSGAYSDEKMEAIEEVLSDEE